MKHFPYNHINVLMIPTDFCNMKCAYCFNTGKSGKEKQVMPDEIMEQAFKIIIPYYDEIRFIWHGAEPLSVGKDFYERALRIQLKYNTNSVVIENSIQTNLTLLNDEFARFLIDNSIHIGSSYDGTRNELTRHNSDGILNGYRTLKKNGGDCGFICVVQNKNIDSLIEDYNWFKNNQIDYTLNQYLSSPPYEEDPLFVPADHYIDRICELFDYWMYDSECCISISYFERFVDYVLFGKKDLCCYNSCMGKHIGISFDGTIQACNREFLDEYHFGSVFDYNRIYDCFESAGFKKMLNEAVVRRRSCKDNCSIYGLCEGGCNNVAFVAGGISNQNEYYCSTMIGIYNHIKDGLASLKTDNSMLVNPYIQKLIDKKTNG